jgi:hypothetical protein
MKKVVTRIEQLTEKREKGTILAIVLAVLINALYFSYET